MPVLDVVIVGYLAGSCASLAIQSTAVYRVRPTQLAGALVAYAALALTVCLGLRGLLTGLVFVPSAAAVATAAPAAVLLGLAIVIRSPAPAVSEASSRGPDRSRIR
jgi:hypothetical protein